MPRENRKRGKKHKKSKEDYGKPEVLDEQEGRDGIEEEPEQRAGPSWIVDRSNSKQEDTDPDAPFGYVDPDVKAYFKTVDDKLREWQELRDEAVDYEEENPNEERKTFIIAALDELSGKEHQLATDPDCSSILERMSYSMDDFVKRVFIDRLAGSYEQLARHRFGSHVVQTLLSISSPTIQREMNGIFPPSPESSPDAGELPHLTHLIINVCEELLPSIPQLLNDPFASHVIRALILVLCPSLTPSEGQNTSIVRSKKSAKHRAKRGPMKSVFSNVDGEESVPGVKGKAKEQQVPAVFNDMARKIVDSVKDRLSENEVRALAADKSGCPVLVLLLEAEVLQGTSNSAGSIMDIVSAGLVTLCQEKEQVEGVEASDYVSTLLRDPSSSHVMEKLVLLSAEPVFNMLWKLYFQGNLARLAAHPVANFVVARAITRLDDEHLKESLLELKDSWPKLIKTSRTGVLKTFIDRSLIVSEVQQNVCQSVLEAFGFTEDVDRKLLLPCLMSLKTLADYSPSEGPPKSEIQGSLLLQSMLKLSEPFNQHVTDSLISLSIDELIALSHNPISSRVIDSFFESFTIPARTKRKLVLSLIGHYHELVDDRIGSRVGERCWEFADPYLKEKIARSLIPYELPLAASLFGKFFVRRLQLPLLKRDTELWKSVQAKPPATPIKEDVKNVDKRGGLPRSSEESDHARKGRREERSKKRNADEIDEVFAVVAKKHKKGSLAVGLSSDSTKVDEKTSGKDKGLDSVLGAIRSAPQGKELKGKNKR